MWGGADSTRYQWMLIVVIAFGLVGMHHLVHTHTGHPTPMTMASATSTGHAHHDFVVVNPVEVASTSVAVQIGCCDPMDMVGHFCLAVLTAITALVVALIFVAARRRLLESGYLLATVSAVAARAPPMGCDRLAQLCVLRR